MVAGDNSVFCTGAAWVAVVTVVMAAAAPSRTTIFLSMANSKSPLTTEPPQQSQWATFCSRPKEIVGPPTNAHADHGSRNSSGSLAIFAAIRRASPLTQCEVQKVRRPYSGAAGLSFPFAARLRLAAASEFVSR